MATFNRFAEVLETFVHRSGYTPGQLQQLSGIPRRTIANWLGGRVQKPQRYSDLLKLAAALHLEVTEVNQLLFLTGYPPIGTLQSQEGDEEGQALLLRWRETPNVQTNYSPFQIIPDLPYFVGRTAELQWLQDKILESRLPRIFCLEGMGGAGKTTLAVKVAYLLQSYFPDGVLWARLHTTDMMAALHSFVQAYGRNIDKDLDLDSRSRILREILADKRALILLDNAESSEQITPFLPPSSSKCTVLVTTRRRDLDATVGATRLSVNPFKSEESLELFSRIVGEEKLKEQLPQFMKLAALLGNLPLAISIAAGRLAHLPGKEISRFVDGLQVRQPDMTVLSSESQSVNQSFLLSYNALTSIQQHFFTMLAVFAGKDFSAEAAAYVADLPEVQARELLRKLYALSLIQARESGRYALHPLIHLFVCQKLEDKTSISRFIEYFVQLIEMHQADAELIAREFESIVSAVRMAFERGDLVKGIRGVLAFVPYLTNIGFFTDAREQLQIAMNACQQINDNDSWSVLWYQAGKIARKQGRYGEATEYVENCLEIDRQNQLGLDISGALCELGTISIHQGHYAKAKEQIAQSLEMAESRQNFAIACDARATLGILHGRLGQVAEAKTNFQMALSQARLQGDKARACRLLNNLGAMHRRLGDLEQSKNCFEESLLLSRQLNQWEHTTVCLNNLAILAQRQGDYAEANRLINEALAIARRIGFPLGVVQSSLNLGMLAHARKNNREALRYLRNGLQLARELKHPWYLAFALNELGLFYINTAKPGTALELFLEAQQIAAGMGAAELKAKSLFGLAQVNARQGLKEKAKKLAKESIAEYKSASLMEAAGQVRDWVKEMEDATAANK